MNVTSAGLTIRWIDGKFGLQNPISTKCVQWLAKVYNLL